jgi:hypothetical protein
MFSTIDLLSIGKGGKDVIEKDIRELYKDGKISDSNYQLLKEKIALNHVFNC